MRVAVRYDEKRQERITDYYLSDDPLIDSFKMKVSIWDYQGKPSLYNKWMRHPIDHMPPKRQIEELRETLDLLPSVKGDK